MSFSIVVRVNVRRRFASSQRASIVYPFRGRIAKIEPQWFDGERWLARSMLGAAVPEPVLKIGGQNFDVPLVHDVFGNGGRSP